MDLHYNERHLRDFSPLLSLLPIAVFIADDKGQIIFCNKVGVSTIGPPEGNVLAHARICSSNVPCDFKMICREVLAGRQPERVLISITHPTHQHTAYYKLSAELFLDKYVLFTAVDQTEKVELEQIIEEKKKQSSSVMNSLGDLTFKLDSNGNIIAVWPDKLSGSILPFRLLEGNQLADSFPPTVADTIVKTLISAIGSSSPGQMEFSYSHEGAERTFSAAVYPIQQGIFPTQEAIVVMKEVTEEKKMQRHAAYKNRLVNQLTSIKDGPLLHVIEGDPLRFNFISGNILSLTGYSEDELSSGNWLDLVHEDDREGLIGSLKELRSKPQLRQRDLVYRIRGREGDIKWINNHISKTDTDTDEVLIGLILNVTEIHSLHDKLKQRERILTNASQVALIGGWEFDLNNQKFHLTDEIYAIHERKTSDFDIGKSLNHYVKEHQPLIRKYLEDLVDKGKNFDAELQLVTGTGNLKWVRTVGCAEWHDGQITHIYGIIQDIDEKKKQELVLEENERRFNAAFELAPLGIGLLSRSGRWLRVNAALTLFFELPKNRLLEMPIQELKLTDGEGKPSEGDDILQNVGRIHQWEKKIVTENGSIKWGRFNINAVKNESGEPSYYILQVVDITESKEYEENLLIANKEAEEANKIKSDFLSTMTHEIRTPLFGVIGITNLLLEEIENPEHLEQLRALKFSSDSLLLLVNDILDFSKIKSGVLSLELKPFELKRIVEAIEELNLPRAKERGNRIVIDYDKNLAPAYLGDELRLGQILNNLVNNAVKFTRNGLVEISIRKTSEAENNHQLLFSVKDTGIGIPYDKQSSIFDQFTQADPSISRRYGGTGLGLSIAKGLVAAMGSEIHLISEPGQGTTISFGLSLKKAETGPRFFDPQKEEKKDLQGKTILLVEDNATSMLVSTQHLKKWNAQVIQAVDGKKAVEQFLKYKNEIDLVLVDIHIPFLSGFEVAEQINKINSSVPIVAVTASTEESEKPTSSIQAYLIKPFNSDDFYRIIKEHL